MYEEALPVEQEAPFRYNMMSGHVHFALPHE
jgi:hypothetical protein